MKTLVLTVHPNIETSQVNKKWIEVFEKYSKKYTIHELSN